jgi:hypothetical protein
VDKVVAVMEHLLLLEVQVLQIEVAVVVVLMQEHHQTAVVLVEKEL